MNKMTKLAGFPIVMMMVLQVAFAQHGGTIVVEREGAREVVARINAGFGTLYLKRGDGDALARVREKLDDDEDEQHDTTFDVSYHVENGVGYLTLDLNGEDGDDMNALACLFEGSASRTWYVYLNDDVPIRFDLTLGAGRAAVDLTDLRVRAFKMEAGAATVRMSVDKPNDEQIDRVSISAGVGSVSTRRLGNLRFRRLDFEGGMGSYRLDCTGALPDRSKIYSDVGVGSMIITLPEGVGAKARTDEHFLNSQKMYRFIRHSDNVYTTQNFSSSNRKVLLDLQSGVGSVAVRWAK